MSDTASNYFIAHGTAAERAAFTPDPATPAAGPDQGYFFYETDTGDTYAWDGSAWQQVNTGSGAGDVVGPASSVASEIVLFDGTTGKLIKSATGTGIVRVSSGVYGTPGAVDLTSEVTGALPIANGGTGQTAQTAAFDALAPTTTKGDVIVHNGTDNIRLAVGTNGQVLTADSAEASGVKWAAGGGTSTVVQEVYTQTGAVATGTTTIPIDDTIPQNTEGTEFMTLAITPTSATNILRIDVTSFAALSASAIWLIRALFQDSTANALAAVPTWSPTNNSGFAVTFTHFMVAGTTSATTFKLRIGGSGASTVTFNGVGGSRYLGGVMASSISITEFVP